MTATDELRKLLDERGMEWESKDVEGVSGFHDTRWNAYDVRWCYVEFVGNNYTKLIPSSEFHCTPEQAIAMTLGDGECENIAPDYLDFLCSKCGFIHYHSDENDTGDGNDWSYCPNCGKAVKR